MFVALTLCLIPTFNLGALNLWIIFVDLSFGALVAHILGTYSLTFVLAFVIVCLLAFPLNLGYLFAFFDVHAPMNFIMYIMLECLCKVKLFCVLRFLLLLHVLAVHSNPLSRT